MTTVHGARPDTWRSRHASRPCAPRSRTTSPPSPLARDVAAEGARAGAARRHPRRPARQPSTLAARPTARRRPAGCLFVGRLVGGRGHQDADVRLAGEMRAAAHYATLGRRRRRPARRARPRRAACGHSVACVPTRSRDRTPTPPPSSCRRVATRASGVPGGDDESPPGRLHAGRRHGESQVGDGVDGIVRAARRSGGRRRGRDQAARRSRRRAARWGSRPALGPRRRCIPGT